MENTSEFVEKLHDTQEKAEKNKKHNGEGNENKVLPNKQHGTNK